MSAPSIILDLVARFGEHAEAYKSGSYNETQLRRDFLDPFFKALGWDMDNEQGYAEAYRDVIHEDQVRIGGALKAPDYGFRIGGARKFFLEAKKPSVRIKEDVPPAYQLRRYAWSAKLQLSILSDFEELAVYDCRIKPAQDDPASKARIFYCRFDEYVAKWDWIESIFSRQAVLKGSFDKFADTNKAKRGTAEVDADFLATIEGWRSDLARNLALRNPALTQRELNFSVQLILDRIIFLRICEDRAIEDYKRLYSITDRPGLYPRLIQIFRQADERYNSGLFHFKSEKGRHESPDALTPGLIVDDSLLKQIIRSLYYPESPYEFRMLSADILGQVYEQFLGKVIRITDGRRAVVEDKPAVKKAGGVYYTPTYIVKYIVKQTVGKLIEGRTPKQITQIRVLDPACGSGSFLIGVYQLLLDWYQQWYLANDPGKWAKGKSPALTAAPSGGWLLSTTERKRILLAHIYGVDIDSQAVEVTKLSLLLKVLEGETMHTLQRELISERVLPDLSENIKCGNSLVASDFYDQSNLVDLDMDSQLRINAFDWASPGGFPKIMQAGGFDAVVGNPPYVQLSMEDFKEETVNAYLKQRFGFSGGRLNTFAFFIDQARRLVLPSGKISFIVPNTILTQEGYEELRNRLIKSTTIEALIQSRGQIFASAVVETVILVLGGQSAREADVQFGWINGDGTVEEGTSTPQKKLATNYRSAFATPADTKSIKVKECMESSGLRMGEMLNFNQAIALKHDRAACLDSSKKTAKHRMVLDGRHITRYFVGDSPNYFKFDLSKIHSCKREDIFLLDEKIFMRRVGDRIIAALDAGQRFALNTIVVVSPKETCDWSPKYALGVLNSKAVNFYYVAFLKSSKKTFSEIQARQVAQIPLPAISLQKAKDRVTHDRIVTLVEQMLSLQGQMAGKKTPHEQTVIERKIASTEVQIDREVYALYGLGEREIGLIEGVA